MKGIFLWNNFIRRMSPPNIQTPDLYITDDQWRCLNCKSILNRYEVQFIDISINTLSSVGHLYVLLREGRSDAPNRRRRRRQSIILGWKQTWPTRSLRNSDRALKNYHRTVKHLHPFTRKYACWWVPRNEILKKKQLTTCFPSEKNLDVL